MLKSYLVRAYPNISRIPYNNEEIVYSHKFVIEEKGNSYIKVFVMGFDKGTKEEGNLEKIVVEPVEESKDRLNILDKLKKKFGKTAIISLSKK